MGGKKVWELVLEIGHRSTPLNKKLSNGYTHKWTAFVKGTSNSKIEHCVSKVVFQLHESFDNPHREITEPPYQIKETGYAGFEIPIQIFFKNKDKPNHLPFVHDLTLLNNKPNNHSSMEKIKFINPNKEFEKYLIRAGAQLLPAPSKKDRCESPPAKKQKSSSLIPSKDMSKVGQSQNLTQSQHHHSSHHKSSSSSSYNHNNHGSHHHSRHDHSNHHNSNHHHLKDNHHSASTSSSSSKNHQTSKQHASTQQTKPKPSNSFVDIFGKPLVYNQTQETPSSRPSNPISNPSSSSGYSTTSLASANSTPANHNSTTLTTNSTSSSNPLPNAMSNPPLNHSSSNSTSNQPLFAVLQNRIACLNDCDRLQKIVDIVEESGEFNMTSTKFEFDLKRLDKKTLSTIESLIN